MRIRPEFATPNPADPSRNALLEARLHDPHGWLGPHQQGTAWTLRVFRPRTRRVWLVEGEAASELRRDPGTDLFTLQREGRIARPCRLRVEDEGGTRETFDPYSFPLCISDHDRHLFNSGRLLQSHRTLGAVRMRHEGVDGVRFGVWAPAAERVSVVGDFNHWDGRAHPMTVHGSSGIWELFVPDLAEGALYKFEIRNRDTGAVTVKTDPYGLWFELRPGTAARVAPAPAHLWRDAPWLERRSRSDWLHAPMSIYEVHAGSWRRHPDGRRYTWGELAESLVPYARDMGFTHIELLPISEHPLDESWGYQTTGYFGPTSRFGDPDGLRAFVDACHGAGLGVLLDWVPGHFPTDAWALARFDGTALYEHEDPRLGLHADWGTHVFNYGRNEVRGFLLASAHYWLSEFHFDGLRVDAVASMLYLDYSRREGEWQPNRYGGRENLEAIDFLRELNAMVHADFPGAVVIAEESTAWPMVSRPTDVGGLGFSMKWNMGWMHDTLAYVRRDPIHRRHHHNELTFGQLYAYSENYLLPFSHDEVVHLKGSMLGKMPGDRWQKFANLRALLVYQMTYPGKKLNFMGNELATPDEWNVSWELAWGLLTDPAHAGVQSLLRDLNRLYAARPELHELDFEREGFRWLEVHDAAHSTLSYARFDRRGRCVVVALNFTPIPRPASRLGVPVAGRYVELVNSDSRHYGGTDMGNLGHVESESVEWNGMPRSIRVTLPPLAGVVLASEPG